MIGNLKKSKLFIFIQMYGIFKYANLGEHDWPYYLVSTWNPSTAPEVIWLFGPKSSGKTLLSYYDGARKPVEYDSAADKFLNWGEHSINVISLDNLHEGKIPYDKIIHLLDAISLGYSNLTRLVRKVYLISRTFPEETFPEEMKKNGNVNGLLGRISNYIYFDHSLPEEMSINEKIDFLSNYMEKWQAELARYR